MIQGLPEILLSGVNNVPNQWQDILDIHEWMMAKDVVGVWTFKTECTMSRKETFPSSAARVSLAE